MEPDLRLLAFSEGGSNDLKTEQSMLQKIKTLAVVSLHSSVHIVNLHNLQQQSDKTVQAFAARVRGVAASCNLCLKVKY